MKKILLFEDSAIKWSIAALLIAIPLYPKFPLFNVPGTYVAIRAEDFFIAVLALVFLTRLMRTFREFIADRINQAFILFFIIGLISVFSAAFITNSVTIHLALLHWVRRIEYAIPFFITASFIRNSQQTRFFVETLFIAAFGVFLYGLGQMYLGFPVISTQNAEFAKGLALRWHPGVRLHSTFGGHYDLAAFLVLVLAFAFGYVVWAKRAVVKLLSLGSIITSYWLLLLSGARISVAAYFGSITLMLLLLKKWRLLFAMLFISTVMMFAFGDLAAKYKYTFQTTGVKVINVIKNSLEPKKVKGADLNTLPQTPNIQVAQVNISSLPEDRSTSIRINAEWPRALNAFFKNPLLGTGYSSITLATDNDFLRALGETGLLGLLAFLLIMVRILERLWNYFIHTKENNIGKFTVIGAIGATIGILITATFIDVFEASKVAIVYWTLVGIAVGVATHESKMNVS